jgi:hypothetical protein
VRVLAGDSFYAVMKDWNARGVRTTEGNEWVPTTIKRTLTLPRLAGLRVHQGDEFPGVWPAIISVDDHRLLVARAARPRNRKPHAYLLTGMVATPDGAPIVAGGPKVDGRRRYKGPGVVIPADPVEDEVAARLLARLDSKALAGALARDRNGSGDARARAVAREIAAVDEALLRINDLYVDGHVTKADAARRRAEREAERDALRRRLASIDGARALPASLPSAARELTAWWAAASLDDRRRLLSRFVDRVEIRPARAPGRWAEPEAERVRVVWRRA